jgi:D-glycero-alpha-D-manno-heptose-7-phosphate kinase
MEHPAIREAIRKYFPYEGLEIHHHGDLPARSGVGSSSAFAVGIIHSLKKLRKDRNIDKFTLAKDAIELEQTILRDNVGSQDQIACAYGNFNKISFLQEDKGFIVEPISISPTYAKSMLSRMVLVYTGLPRMSSNISKGLLANLPRKKKLILRTMEMAEESHKLFQAEADLDFMGDFLKENWSLKSSMNEKAITPPLNQLYEEAIKYGAEGGKVLGAGGGGFLLFWLADGARDYFLKKFDRGTVVPFAFEKFGTQTIFDSHEIV